VRPSSFSRQMDDLDYGDVEDVTFIGNVRKSLGKNYWIVFNIFYCELFSALF
jgi:hypothetical protein